MLRGIFSSKLVLAGLLFCVLIVACSLFYRWHVERGIREDEARTERFLQQLETNKRARAQQLLAPTDEGAQEQVVETPIETDDGSETVSDATEPLTTEEAERVDTAEELFREVSVSPFGLGAYPEVPADYIANRGIPIWYEHNFGKDPATATHEKNVELIDRVLIKLWKEGEDVRSGFYKDGKVYPLYSKSAYVKYYDSIHHESRSTGLTVMKSPDFDIKLSIERLQNGDIPADYWILDLDTSGIDAYAFLGL